MRITFVLPGVGLSGGTRIVAGYAQRLKQRGHRVLIVSMAEGQPSLKRKAWSLLRTGRWPQPRVAGPSHLDGIGVDRRILPWGRWVTDADVPDADVVIATWWETSEHVAKLSPSKGAKAYFIQGDEQIAYGAHPAEMRARINATWSLPLHKIVVARWLVQLARERCGDGLVSYVPNAVDHGQFFAEPRTKQRIPTVGLLYSGTWCKGTDISLKAFELARRQIPTLHLRGFGMDDPERSLPLPAGAEYVRQPAQDRIRDIYARCDAWLFGSRTEGFGLPILEAMACRTPVIATPAGAAPELVAGGGGILVNAEDPQSMADAIDQVAGMSESDWQVRSDAAVAAASAYTWDDATRFFEEALETAVDRHKSSKDKSDFTGQVDRMSR